MEDRKKLQKFAIRKLSMGVGSVLIGLAFIGGTLEPKLVQADETKQVSFHYLAERVGITPANLSILKTGKAKAIRFSTLEAICKELGCQPGDILEYVPD